MELIWASLSGMRGKNSHSPDKLRVAIRTSSVRKKPYDKGLLTMRRTSLIFMGAITGVGLTLMATHPRTLFGGSSATAASAAYQQLNLFADVYERVRADYVEKPDDSELVATAIQGMVASLDPHSSYMDPRSLGDMQIRPTASSAASASK